jgi:hypothetical protein
MALGCPLCCSEEVHRSRSANSVWLLPLRLFSVKVRCRTCFALFRVRGPLLLGPDVPEPRAGKEPATEHAIEGLPV